jgi:hypothetical protein
MKTEPQPTTKLCEHLGSVLSPQNLRSARSGTDCMRNISESCLCVQSTVYDYRNGTKSNGQTRESESESESESTVPRGV